MSLGKYKKITKQILSKPLGGIVVGFFIIFTILTVLAFTEPLGAPSIAEPENATSTGNIETLLGTTTSASTGVTTIFDFLRQIYTNIGQTPESVPGFETDAGRIKDLIGDASPAVADGKTIFRFLKAINDNLDFPDVANVREIDTVMGVSGGILNRVVSNATLDQSAGYYEAFNLAEIDTDLTASNIASGVTIFGILGNLSTTTWSSCYLDNDLDGYSSGLSYTIGIWNSCENVPGNRWFSSSGNDCNDTNPDIWQNLTCYPDVDGDGYGNYLNAGSIFCSGSSCASGVSTNLDCDDATNTIGKASDNTCDGDSDGFLDYTAFAIKNGNWLGWDLDDGNSDVSAGKSGTIIFKSNARNEAQGGNFGGIAGADNWCRNNKPSIICNNIYAFISSYTVNYSLKNLPALYGFQDNHPVYFYGQTSHSLTKFANNWPDMFDNSIMAYPNAALELPWTSNWIDHSYYTGADKDGNYSYGDCLGWTTNNESGAGYYGYGGIANGRWLNYAYMYCGPMGGILCACTP